MLEMILKDKLSKEQIDQIKEAISEANLVQVSRPIYEQLLKEHTILRERVISLERELDFRAAVVG